jgi:hypothetical protein
MKLNPFSDECQKDYMLYLEMIIQDESLAREEAKKYMILKSNKAQEKFNIYHSIFLSNISAVLLIDGYFSNGKILYASHNFPDLFNYNGKEILSLTIDDLIPYCMQSFHKELVNDAIKYSNIKYIFKEPRDSLLKNKRNEIFNIKKFVKPVPNLSYGLIYITYLQKIHNPNLNIILDKNLKISGFTQMLQIDSSFSMNRRYNLSSELIGYHIGLIIPEVLPLLEYKNDEFNIIKKDFEIKGYLYSVGNKNEIINKEDIIKEIKGIKNKVDIILDKIKNNKISINDYKGEIEDDPQNISFEFNEFINELSAKKIKSFSIFYKINLKTFIDGKYKYYIVNINDDIISENEFLGKENEATSTPDEKNSKFFKSTLLKNKISKTTLESKKKIKIKVEKNNNHISLSKENTNIDKNNASKFNNTNNKESNSKDNHEKTNKNNDHENINEANKEIQNGKKLKSMSSNKSSVDKRGCNKIKDYILDRKETFPLKIMKGLCFIIGLAKIALMI